MRKREYHRFPLHDVEFTQSYSFWADLPYLVKTFAGMNDKSGSFRMVGPKGKPINAKRNINVDITEASVVFTPLVKEKLDNILQDIEDEGILDFRFHITYSYLDRDYHRVAFKKDMFLVRGDLFEGVLSLKIHPMDGPGHTTSAEIADTIVSEISQGHDE